MNKQEEIDYILQLKKEANDATFDRRLAANELWTLYQNKQNYSKKKDWQSKIFVPKIFMSVEQATAIVKRAIMSPRRLFKVNLVNPDDDVAKDAMKDVDRTLKRHLKESNFATSYAETMKEAFLVGFGVPKVLWEGGLKFVNVPTSKHFRDPDWQSGSFEPPKYDIEEKEMDLSELKDMAKRINDDAGRSVFNMTEINKIKEDQRDIEHETEERVRRGLSQHNKTDKRVIIKEFWGTIVDKKTNKVKKKQLRVVANDKWMIRSQNNPFDHQLPPYIPVVPITYPHRGAWGVSLVEPIVRMQYAYNNIMNLGIDNLNFSVNKIFEYQPSALVNPKSLTQLYPGKLVAKHTSAPAIQEVRTSGLGQDSFFVLDLLQSEMQKGTAITEFLLGTAGKSKTATEAELKTAQAQGLFDTIARDLETNSLSPLIQMSFDLLIQFKVIPEELRGRYKFDVGGLSLLLVRREQTERVERILGLALQSQTVASMTNIRELYSKYLNLLNLEDVLAEDNQGPNADQQQLIDQDAAEQAKKQVASMSDEEILAS
ncbi:hypothetical protein LCGC14_1009660 [marine sediment metagenome]|uniref:Portal protein n=1 Tax=marine sediment metagenome TaxID=412755 RepID=A0A0F9R6R1_9ZZZZ